MDKQERVDVIALLKNAIKEAEPILRLPHKQYRAYRESIKESDARLLTALQTPGKFVPPEDAQSG